MPSAKSKTSYEQVEGAALEITASGGRPTLRSVREHLGGGSLAVIGRHLATWNTHRTRAQSSTPFTVGPQDVEALSPTDFAALINHLVRLETRQYSLPTVPDTTSRINDADGGIDGMIAWSGGPSRTPRFPSRKVVWQAKSGRRLSPSDLVREIMRRDGSGIKPHIHAALAAGGSYVVYSAADLTADQKSARISAMVAAARPYLPGIESQIHIAAADEIAGWAAADLWARTFLIRAAGREYTALLSTFEEWARLANFDNEYVWDQATHAIAGEIQSTARAPGSTYRLVGAPGLGKTRLVYEALKPLVEDGLGVVYFDARYPGSGLQLLNVIPDWRRFGVGGTLVVDDCDSALHEQIASATAGTSLSVILINYKAQLNADATLRARPPETIEQIVKSFDSPPAQQHLMRIVHYAQGWPLMAVLISKALRTTRAFMVDLTNDQLTQRLIGFPEGSPEYEVLALLALFDHVGYREGVASEWEHLRDLFLPDVSHDAFHRTIKYFERNGLVVAVGRYWRVTPPPLAIRLASQWLDNASTETKGKLFRSLPDGLMDSLARRLGDVTTQTSVSLAADLLSPTGPFGNADSILGNIKIVKALAEVNPVAGIGALSRTLPLLTDEQLISIDDAGGRQYLVWTLEALAFHGAHFRAAARLLFDLARNENERTSNNATGTLVKFFAVRGSQTEANPDERIAVIDFMLENGDPRSSAIIAKSLACALSINPNYVRAGVESQGGRPDLVEWQPTIWKDIFDYYAACVERIGLLSTRSAEAYHLARSVAAEAIPLLVRHRRWDELEAMVGNLVGTAWPKAVDRLKWSIRSFLKDSADVEITRAERLLESMVPTDFLERVTLFVSQPPSDLQQLDNRTIDRSIENVEHFAQETIEAGRVREVLDVISSGWSHRLPHAYGQAVAKRVTNRTQLIDDVLAAYANASEPRNDLALMSVIGTLGEADPDLRRSTLARIAADSRLVHALPAAVIWPRIESEDVDLLIQAFADGRLSEPPRPNLFMGSAYANLDDHRLRALANVFLDRQWFSSVVALLTFGIQNRSGFDDILTKVILESDFVATPMDEIHEWSLLEITKRLLADVSFALEVVERMIRLALSDKVSFAAQRRVSDLWPALLDHDLVWQRFKRAYTLGDPHDRWRLLIATQHDTASIGEDRLAIERRPIDDLIAFAQENIDDAPYLLAQYGLMIKSEPDGFLRLTPLMLALLEHFGDRDDLLRALDANMHSFLSVGPRAGYYSSRIALLDEIPSFGRRKVDVWKEELRAAFDSQRQRAQFDDEEFEKGIY